MLPLKDTLPGGRFPAVTVALGAAVLVALAGGSLLALGATLFVVWLFGPSVERALGRAAFAGFCALGGAAGIGVQEVGGAAGLDAAAGAAGAVAAVLGAYLLLFPRARVLCLVLVPLAFTLVEVPAAILLGLWLAAQAGLGVLDLADAAGLAFGALTIRLLVRERPSASVPLPYRV